MTKFIDREKQKRNNIKIKMNSTYGSIEPLGKRYSAWLLYI